MRHVCLHVPPLIVCRQVHNASALKEYTGQHFRNASRDWLARLRGFTTLSDEAPVDASGTHQTDHATRLQLGAPFATLFKLPSQRNEPTTCAVGVLSATAPPSTDTRVGSMGGQVVKGHLTKLLVGGDGSLFEWEARKLRKETTYICPLRFEIELDPDMRVDELLSTQEVLVETVGLVEGFKETPVMRPFSSARLLNLHLGCGSDITGNARFLCCWDGRVSGLQNGGGCTGIAATRWGAHPRDQGTLCLPSWYKYVCPLKPARSVLLGEAYRTASKTLAMTSLLYSCYDSI